MPNGPIRVAVMADTHGLLRPDVEEVLRSCDQVIHAGDFDNLMLYQKLSAGWPLYAVRGNNDKGWSGGLPLVKRFTIGGVKFIMAHERTDVPSGLGDVQVVIFGHSHIYQEQRVNGRLWLNPGSCGYKRNTLPLSLAVMEVEGGRYTYEPVWLEKGYGTRSDAIAQREKAALSHYQKRQQRHIKQHERHAGSEKEELFMIARIQRQLKGGFDVGWIVENTGEDATLVRLVYEISGRSGTPSPKAVKEEIDKRRGEE